MNEFTKNILIILLVPLAAYMWIMSKSPVYFRGADYSHEIQLFSYIILVIAIAGYRKDLKKEKEEIKK